MTDAQDRGHAPEEAPPARGRARRWARITALILAAPILAASAVNITDAATGGVFKEGRAATGALVTLAESILDEFALAETTPATIEVGGPVICADAPPWAPNRVTFAAGIKLSLPNEVRPERVLDFAASKASELGLKPSQRSGTFVQYVTARGTVMNIRAYPGVQGGEGSGSLSITSRCFPRPRGYRSADFETGNRLRNDWPERIGFQTGPLSEARVR